MKPTIDPFHLQTFSVSVIYKIVESTISVYGIHYNYKNNLRLEANSCLDVFMIS